MFRPVKLSFEDLMHSTLTTSSSVGNIFAMKSHPETKMTQNSPVTTKLLSFSLILPWGRDQNAPL